MEIEAVLEANKNLNKKIEALERELTNCRFFEEKYYRLYKTTELLEERLTRQERVARVLSVRNGTRYVEQVTDVQYTPDGIVVEITSPTTSKEITKEQL